MEEKVLIQSERYKVKRILFYSIGLGFIAFLLTLIWQINLQYQDFLDSPDSYFNIYLNRYVFVTKENYNSMLDFAMDNNWSSEIATSAIIFAIIAAIGIFIYFWFRNYQLVVTDKRIYGRVAFGKQVDLPVDSVSAIASVSVFKGVSVSTASGKLSFLAIKNAKEIRNVLSNLIIERQNKQLSKTEAITTASDYTEELKKIKDLLDAGVITQEEFDTKKKQILGL